MEKIQNNPLDDLKDEIEDEHKFPQEHDLGRVSLEWQERRQRSNQPFISKERKTIGRSSGSHVSKKEISQKFLQRLSETDRDLDSLSGTARLILDTHNKKLSWRIRGNLQFLVELDEIDEKNIIEKEVDEKVSIYEKILNANEFQKVFEDVVTENRNLKSEFLRRATGTQTHETDLQTHSSIELNYQEIKDRRSKVRKSIPNLLSQFKDLDHQRFLQRNDRFGREISELLLGIDVVEKFGQDQDEETKLELQRIQLNPTLNSKQKLQKALLLISVDKSGDHSADRHAPYRETYQRVIAERQALLRRHFGLPSSNSVAPVAVNVFRSDEVYNQLRSGNYYTSRNLISAFNVARSQYNRAATLSHQRIRDLKKRNANISFKSRRKMHRRRMARRWAKSKISMTFSLINLLQKNFGRRF